MSNLSKQAGRERLVAPAAASEKSIPLKPEEVKWKCTKVHVVCFNTMTSVVTVSKQLDYYRVHC
jgi:hypothetical protein